MRKTNFIMPEENLKDPADECHSTDVISRISLFSNAASLYLRSSVRFKARVSNSAIAWYHIAVVVLATRTTHAICSLFWSTHQRPLIYHAPRRKMRVITVSRK